MIYIWYFLRRVQCFFGWHFWAGVHATDDFTSEVDYYYCMTCYKEQKHSPYKEDKNV